MIIKPLLPHLTLSLPQFAVGSVISPKQMPRIHAVMVETPDDVTGIPLVVSVIQPLGCVGRVAEHETRYAPTLALDVFLSITGAISGTLP